MRKMVCTLCNVPLSLIIRDFVVMLMVDDLIKGAGVESGIGPFFVVDAALNQCTSSIDGTHICRLRIP